MAPCTTRTACRHRIASSPRTTRSCSSARRGASRRSPGPGARTSTRVPDQRSVRRHDGAMLLLAPAAAGWALTAARMDGMAAGPGSDLGSAGWFAVSWLLMTAAMMLPAITPMVLAHSRRFSSGRATAARAVGYLVTWVAAGLVAYMAVEGVR